MLVGRRLQERASERERERGWRKRTGQGYTEERAREAEREERKQQASVSLSCVLIEATISKFLVDVMRFLRKLFLGEKRKFNARRKWSKIKRQAVTIGHSLKTPKPSLKVINKLYKQNCY